MDEYFSDAGTNAALSSCSPVDEDEAPPLTGKRERNGLNRAAARATSPWQRMLDANALKLNTIDDESSADGKYFRRRFRMPFSLFQSLIGGMLKERWFPKYGPQGEGPLDAAKHRGASLQVKVLSVFRVLGRGLVFDECQDGSGCGEDSVRVFFHAFVSIFSKRLFQVAVKAPSTIEELKTTTGIYQKLGMGAALGSTDCTHIYLGNCPNKFRVPCTGRSGKPSMSYSVTCDHARKIFYCSCGFMGSKNDKHISTLDSFIASVKDLELYKTFEWNVDVDESSIETRRGVFLICDGGYHKWPHMMCGLKHTSSKWHTLWSIQLESVRKDVECTFGILKCRFQVLANYFPYVRFVFFICTLFFIAHFIAQYGKDWNEYREKIDSVMWTCCILHNLLLRHDGLEFLWTPKWVCSWAYQDPDLDRRDDFDGPPIEARSKRRMRARFFGTSDAYDNGGPQGHEPEGEVGIGDLSYTERTDGHLILREDLVRQFKIRYKKEEVHWLKYPLKKKR